MDVEILKTQLEEIELKSAKLDKKIDLFKAIKQDFYRDLGKDIPAKEKN